MTPLERLSEVLEVFPRRLFRPHILEACYTWACAMDLSRSSSWVSHGHPKIHPGFSTPGAGGVRVGWWRVGVDGVGWDEGVRWGDEGWGMGETRDAPPRHPELPFPACPAHRGAGRVRGGRGQRARLRTRGSVRYTGAGKSRPGSRAGAAHGV